MVCHYTEYEVDDWLNGVLPCGCRSEHLTLWVSKRESYPVGVEARILPCGCRSENLTLWVSKRESYPVGVEARILPCGCRSEHLTLWVSKRVSPCGCRSESLTLWVSKRAVLPYLGHVVVELCEEEAPLLLTLTETGVDPLLPARNEHQRVTLHGLQGEMFNSFLVKQASTSKRKIKQRRAVIQKLSEKKKQK